MRLWLLGLSAALLVALPAHAQRGGTIRPGMSAEEVRAVFGSPASSRVMGEWTYLYYLNGCPVRCGSDDVVFLQADTVVAAVLRAPGRRFAGAAAATALRETVDLPAREELRPVEGGAAPARGRQAPRGSIRLEPPPVREDAARRAPTTDLGVIRGREPVPAAADTMPMSVDTMMADTAMDRQRQLREQRVEPRTIRRDTLTAPAEGPLDPRRQEREQRVEPRTVRPRPQAPPPPPSR